MSVQNDKTSLTLLSSLGEVGDIRTFVFETGGLAWTAGQAQAYLLPQAGPTPVEHERWFTIASAPSEGVIHISTRVSQSAFKQALNALKPGAEVECYDLGGKFVWEDVGEPVVLVAAGIGVTPFRSILLERQHMGKPLNATLLYFNRTNDIAFQDTLQDLAVAHPEFSVQTLVGERVTAEAILNYAPQAKQQTVYLSGPKPMVLAVGAELESQGAVVKQDRFPGYDETNY